MPLAVPSNWMNDGGSIDRCRTLTGLLTCKCRLSAARIETASSTLNFSDNTRPISGNVKLLRDSSAIQKPYLVAVRQEDERHVELFRVMTALVLRRDRPDPRRWHLDACSKLEARRMTDTPRLWDRRADETPKSYAAFRAYVALSGRRSVREAGTAIPQQHHSSVEDTTVRDVDGLVGSAQVGES